MHTQRLPVVLTVLVSVLTTEPAPRSMPSILRTAGTHQGTLIRVIDRGGSPIPYSLVWVDGRRPITADTLGEVRVDKPLGRGSRVWARRVGFTPLDTTLRAPLEGELVLALDPVDRELAAVVTTAERSTPLARTGFYDRMERVKNGAIRGEFITPEELESRPSGMLAQIFQGRSLVRVTSGWRNVVLRGRADCVMQILLDGHVIELEAADGGLETFVNGNEIMGVELYGSTANAPTELIPLTRNGSCGIVAIWTGPRR